MRALKMSVVAGHSEGDNDLLRAVIKANPLKTVWEIAEKQNVNHSMVILHLKQIGNVKKFVSVCLMRWLQTQTFVILKCLLLFYATTSHFSTGLWCAMKSEFYVTTSNDQLSGRTKKKLQSISQSQICTKRRSWSQFGSLLPVWSTTAFWILVKPLHLRSMLSKPMGYIKNCNACNQHWSRKSPVLLHDNVQPHAT